ncbi:MBL fold metallo-hydrolase [Algiphilus aromaticivorans]|uniref:MBL fold metallo-hydrolase n=1 Tax=Algiphilus aromaticivorans TaxID=382454 RepID=UPI001E46C496|nr:MBL fold metallo-hydrolase [Algiphilus aromaticivorans]
MGTISVCLDKGACAAALLAAAMLTACGGSGSVSDEGDVPADRGDVPAAQWQPLPPAPSLDAETRAAREAILGPDATDPDAVRLWWYGVSSFVMSIGGHLVLLDAWESVGLHADTVPIGREELVALQPEAIFIGHGHFDHAADAGYIAGRTGAALIAGDTVCALARKRAADGPDQPFPCLVLGSDGEPEPGTVQPIRIFADLPAVHVLQHVHSAADPMDLLEGGTPQLFVPDLLTYLLNLNTDPQEVTRFALTLTDDGGFGDPNGGTWAYHFRDGDFGLLWHDSSGPIDEGEPFAAEIRQALDSFPGCVDVQVGAIVGFGMLTSAMRDARLYVEHAHPKLSLPNHHDAWAPVIGPGAAALEQPWRDELATLAHPPELDYLRDPQDFMQSRSFAVDAPRWKLPSPGSSCAQP